MIIPNAEPSFFPGHRVGCLLVHGFNGAPKEMRWMGEHLVNQAYTVLEVRLALPKVRVPALLIHSKQDAGVVPHNAELILAALESQAKQILWLENSGHVIPRKPERHLVFIAAREFVQRVQSPGQAV